MLARIAGEWWSPLMSESCAENSRLLNGLIPESEMAEERDLTTRALREERRRRRGPPFIKIGRRVFYPIEGWHAWLRARVQQPVRERKAS
jgi:hypothetical protein